MRPKMLWKFLVIVLLKLLLEGPMQTLADVQVCVPDLGCLQGTTMPGYHTDQFEAFLGIPFAKPPVAELRFKNPEPFPAWHDTYVLDATKAKPACIQKNYIVPSWPLDGEEDCLYLNLYRPLNPAQERLPVIFYIHGGGLFSGSAHPTILGPEYFMDTAEVIVVTIAYRLGPFGFLSTGDEAMRGNFGLKDQKMALKWVHQHIAAFGGDPDAITIVGHSSGGSSVQFHMLYDTEGLFKRAIISSGNGIAPYVNIQSKPREQTIKLAELVGITNAEQLSSAELANSLRTIDPVVLLNAGDHFRFWSLNPLTVYRPVIESATCPKAIITEDPKKRMKNGNFQHKPWMMALVSNEGEGAAYTLHIVENAKLREELNQHFDEYITKMLALEEISSENTKKAVNMILDEYMGGTHELNDQTAMGFKELFSDFGFYYPFFKSVKDYLNYADLQKNPLYLSLFNYTGPQTYAMVYTGGIPTTSRAVIHYDDLIYLFRTPAIFPDFDKNSKDAELLKLSVEYYVEFAKTGHLKSVSTVKPCLKSDFLSNTQGICDYLSYSNDGETYKIGNENSFNLLRMQLWESILAK